MKSVYMQPTPTHAARDTSNAINGIVLKLARYLPAHGFTLTENPAEASLVAAHAGQTDGQMVCDVGHIHGLYPTAHQNQYPTPGWHWAANAHVIKNVRDARQITVPSNWVADIFKRDLHLSPFVIPWAIDAADWEPGDNQGYVLYNKNREDGVCQSKYVVELASRVPKQLFLTTFGQGTPNLKTIGRQTWEAMRPLTRGAAVYLATTLETFGIATLEAMACGIPVLGFRHGGTADIVEHGVTGYLVEPEDIGGLVEGLDYCLRYRDILGANARAAALRYTWEQVAARFAEVYRLALAPHEGPKVSVVIPCHGYSWCVGEAIESVVTQEANFKFEIIVAIDNDPDAERLLADMREIRQLSVHFGNPADTRNAGIQIAKGEYVVCLDADDKFGHPKFLQVLADTLDTHRDTGIVFTGLRVMDQAGNLGNPSNWPRGYDFEFQVQRQNQVPTCCMFRKEAWVRAGGYRRRYVPAEDADLWLRIGALGYKGIQVTSEPWFVYRLHSNSLSTTIRTGQKVEPDWTGDKPWVKDGQRPFASDGRPPMHAWPVRNYHRPKVSVIIPVGPNHMTIVRDALDSLENQTERFWEAIVINDSGKPLDLRSYPFVRLLDTGGGKGAGYARNRGVEIAKAPLVTFLDADDVQLPEYLAKTLRLYARTGKYIYTDWLSLNKDGEIEPHETPDPEPGDVFRKTSIHAVNVLIPTAWVKAVGGFDEQMAAWEDVDFFMKLAAAGYCGARVPEALLLYRYSTGARRETGETVKADLKALLYERYRDYVEGRKVCGCNSTPKAKTTVTMRANDGSGTAEMVRVEYQGPVGAHDVRGYITKTYYGRRARGDIFYIWPADMNENFSPVAMIEEVVTATPEPPPPEPRFESMAAR